MLQLVAVGEMGIVRTSRRRGSFVVRAELGDTPRSRESSYSFRPFAHSRGYGESMSDWITMRRFHEPKGGADWRGGGEGARARFRTGSVPAGPPLLDAVSGPARLAGPRPDGGLWHAGACA